MDLMDMRLIMITRRDLLRQDMDMVVIATSMSTDLTLITRLRFIIQKLITMDMARDLLSLDMDTVVIATSMSTDLTLITRLRFTIQKLITMDMARDLLSLDMDMALLMFMLSRRIMAMVIQNLMNMDTTFIRDQLNLDMGPMKVTKKFLTLHTPIMISKCTTLTREIEIVPHFRIHSINS